MDTDISTPIEYNPEMAEDVPQHEEPLPHYYYSPPPPQAPVKQDILASLDKTAYIIIFAAFILGFFMGKTMQPVILRHG